jgi:hypothetical protein
MSVFLLGYDLIKEKTGHDYKPLWDELARRNAHRTQYSLWLINLNNTPDQVVAHFQKFVDKDDRIWVTRLRPNEYTYVNAMPGTNAWLQKNPPS